MYPHTDKVNRFLALMKDKCEHKAKEMAKLELLVWDDKHEYELRHDFGFTHESVLHRKEELKKIANS